MTTTPGYTELLQDALEALRAWLNEDEHPYTAQAMSEDVLARAAELTQVTAQNVERASPAKDGGGQAVVWQARKKGGDDEPWWDIDQGTFEGGVIGAVHGAFEYRELFAAAQPLASQMRPQSAVQGRVLVPVEATQEMIQAFLQTEPVVGPDRIVGWTIEVAMARGNTLSYLEQRIAQAYTTMLAAAPQPPQGEG